MKKVENINLRMQPKYKRGIKDQILGNTNQEKDPVVLSLMKVASLKIQNAHSNQRSCLIRQSMAQAKKEIYIPMIPLREGPSLHSRS